MKQNKLFVIMAAMVVLLGMTGCAVDDNPVSIPVFLQPGDTWDAKTGTLTVNSNPGKNAYKARTEIVSVVFSNAVTSIGDSAFYNCHISVVDLPPSVVSIGNEAFAGEDSDLDIVTIHATDCTLGKHPFQQTIVTRIFVPAEAIDAYTIKYPYYSDPPSQFRAIPEVKYEGNEIIWSSDLCNYIWVGIPYYHNGKIVTAHNTQGGITVNYNITDEYSGFYSSWITLVEGEKLTFTSTVGNISKIEIQEKTYEDEDEDEEEEDEYEDPFIPIAKGWTWDATKRTFTWQGTPSATVEMPANGDIDIICAQIRFTID